MLPPLGIAGKEGVHSSHIQGQLRKMYLQNAMYSYIQILNTHTLVVLHIVS